MKFNILNRFKNRSKSGSLFSKKLPLIFIICLAIISLITATAVYYYQGTSFSGGTFNNTLYNSTGKYVYLNYTDSTNSSYVTNGTYVSSVMDYSGTAGFVEIKWKGRGTCPQNMSYINKFGGYCIDQYEASKPDANSTSSGSSTVMATSKPNVLPWATVAQTASVTACANAGKHLCSSLEWLGAANLLGQVYNLPTDLKVSPYYCNTGVEANCANSGSAACPTGSSPNCVSAEGVYDMVGNVAEWVNETVTTVAPNGCTACYPNSTGGWQSSTSAATVKYGNDGVYFNAGTSTGRAVFRGGNWYDGANAGPFYAFMIYVPSSTLGGIGFRCCSSPL